MTSTRTIANIVNTNIDTTNIRDSNSNESIILSATASAVNEVTITNAITTSNPTIAASGDDTNIDLFLQGKGTGLVRMDAPRITSGITDTNGNEMFIFTATGSAINEITFANAATAGAPSITATGDDALIPLDISSTGDADITLWGSAKSERIAVFDPQAAGVNYFNIKNSATGDPLKFEALGSDTNIPIHLSCKGTGNIELLSGVNEIAIFTPVSSATNEITVTNAATGNSPSIASTGGDTNIGLEITPKGSGALVLDGLSWPIADGGAGQVLQTNGSGTLSFVSATTPTTATVQTTGTSPVVIATITTTANTTTLLNCKGISSEDITNSCAFVLKAGFRSDASVASIGSDDLLMFETDSGFDIGTSTSGLNILISVTAATINATDWSIEYFTVTVANP